MLVFLFGWLVYFVCLCFYIKILGLGQFMSKIMLAPVSFEWAIDWPLQSHLGNAEDCYLSALY